MEIISHRGYWKKLDEKNLPVSFFRSFQLGFGVETDIRDYKGELVISHDIPDSKSMLLTDFFEINKETNCDRKLALNIKADGLYCLVADKIGAFGITNYFVFDMSVPDTLDYAKKRLPFFSRQSEYEPVPILYNETSGIWLDAFNYEWYNDKTIKDHLEKGKSVAIVSSEIHNRDQLVLWDWIRKTHLHKLSQLILCTDFPEEAVSFFKD